MSLMGIKGFNKADGSRDLMAAFGNDIVNVDTGLGYGLNLDSSNNVEWEVFLDSLFFQNYNHLPLTFDGSDWTTKNVAKAPLARYLKNYGARMYLGNTSVDGTAYPSRVYYSNLPNNNQIQWGISWGSDGSSWANSKEFSSLTGGFETYGLKVGDPLFITSGINEGEYTIAEIVNDRLIELNEEIKNVGVSQSYWVGGNWFDVRTDDNDIITWLAENNDRLLVFKRDSLHRYDGNSLRRIKGVPGTNSGRSVVNIGGMTYYFHGSTADKTGFYMYDGVTSRKISNAIQPHVAGIMASQYPAIVSWSEGNVMRAFVGDVSNTNENITVNKCVISYDTATRAWSADPISDDILCSTTFRDPDETKVLLGNDESQILTTPVGFNFNGDPIPWVWETQPIYTRGQNVMNIHTRLSIISRGANGVRVDYKLWNNPLKIDDRWTPLGDIEYDRTEFIIPYRHNNSTGISFRFSEMSTKEPTPKIESLSVYSFAQRTTTPEIKQII